MIGANGQGSDDQREHPCADCGEATFNEIRCRDCDIEHVIV